MKNSWKLFLLLAALFCSASAYAQLPEGFDYVLFSDQVPGVTTLEFADNGNIYACDFSGKIWVFVDGEFQSDPVIDISDEVAGYGELGCLSFALHPDFLLNGYIYMLYVVDRHHLFHYGTGNYDPEANEYYAASMGRVTRFQVQLDDYQTLVPDSRMVLFGESPGEGNPALTTSHGTGDILFGTDKSLIFSTGDGNTWENDFAGGDEEIPSTAFDEQGLADGIISAEENVGAFRAQLIQSYSGKVLRIDPITGEGLPSNPYYDENNPDAAQSKVWALGLRNPYRMTLRLGTGSENADDGDPGTIFVTNVGASSWEEIHVCDGPGYNFGWPLYEGMSVHSGFYNKIRKNFYQPNPFQTEGCPSDYFTFQQLLQQENGSHNYFYPNPCNSESDIANYADVFYHTRPILTYRNDSWNPGGQSPLVPAFDDNNNAINIEITNPDLNVEQAEDFGGIAAMTGDFYDGTTFPEEYHNILPVLDYMGWLKVFWFDANQNLTKMEHWMDDMEFVIDLRYNPHDECYYTMTLWPSLIHKLCFTGNLQPVVEASATPQYGTSPLMVTFDATETYDPENDPLTFEWDFGDGENASGALVDHEYTAPNNDPYSFDATLTVSDTAGNVVVVDFLISLNNSPPQVDITSIEEDQLYSMETVSEFPLEADVSDAEHSIPELTFQWNTYLHHNSHFHPLGESSEVSSVFNVNPVGCEEFNAYFYRISLRVTDPEGLEGYDELYIYPDCEGVLSDTNDNTISNSPEILVYPNPANDRLRLEFGNVTEQFEEYTVEVYDITGKIQINRTYIMDPIVKKIGVDIQHLAEGQYIFHAYSDKSEHTGKFLIIRQ